jgi:hypothetical protein
LPEGESIRDASPQDEVSDDASGLNLRSWFFMDRFCLPIEAWISGNNAGAISSIVDDWETLCRFIYDFPGLRDLLWVTGWHVPLFILSAVVEKGCRLHIHNFRLPSLIQSRDDPQPVSTQDYSLLTSPSLSSVVVKLRSFESGGKLNYTEEALLLMVSALAPNLTHLCVYPKGPLGELEVTQAIQLGKPTWKGFFPGHTDTEAVVNDVSVRGRLQTLIFPLFVPGEFRSWARTTDFTYLRSLVLRWEDNGVTLARMGAQGDLSSLIWLKLSFIEDENEEAQHALHQLLKNLKPLERLNLSGYSPTTFDIVSRRHAVNLRSLSIDPSRSKESRNPLVLFSAPVLQHFAANSRHLTSLSIPIHRTRGDEHEVNIYRALSDFTRLQRLSLKMMHSVGPDEESWEEERDGPHPLLGANGEAEKYHSCI